MQVRRVRVQIETTRLRIVGTIRLPLEGYRSRTTDFLNAHEIGFIAVTEAEVLLEGTPPQRHDYLAVNCRHIVAAGEIEDLGVVDEDLEVEPAYEPQPGPAVPTMSVPPPGAG